MLIDGEWTDSEGGGTFETIDPATGEVIEVVPEATPADVAAAVAAAKAAFSSPEWAQMLPAARARLLWRIADLIEEHAEELARLETRDQGQPFGISSAISIPNAVEHFRYYSGWATKLHGLTVPVSIPGVDYRNTREPLGVCGLITPWNFPLMIASWKLAPALVTGNTVVLKPAEQTPLSTLRLAELCMEAGVPRGVINVVTGGPAAGQAIVRHPDVAKISFTGSTEVGREIASVAGRRLARVSLELGGKAPSIITPDADIDSILEGNIMGGLLNCGQVCAAYTRFYIDRTRADEFAEKIGAVASSMKLGNGLEPTTQLGPLVSEDQLQRVDRYVRTGTAEGATLVTGGARAEGQLASGYFYQPTVFANVNDSMTIAREEIFGPVLSVIPYDDPQELAGRANDTEYGLAAVIWSRDIGAANRLAHEINAGTVWINLPPFLDAAAPWGGMKASGVGREMGWEAILAYTDIKSIWTSLS
ncbi:MAG: aldehyde dehydrogenase family protein [Acidimicrobiales bacterium]